MTSSVHRCVYIVTKYMYACMRIYSDYIPKKHLSHTNMQIPGNIGKTKP